MSETFITASMCRLCASTSLRDVLSLGNQFVVGFVSERDDALPRAPLDLIQCEECKLLQLRHSVDPELLWKDYWYRSSINASMRDALNDVVATGLEHHQRGIWLDIGANDGWLLSRVPRTFQRIACEPARTFTDELAVHCDRVICDYFSAVPLDTSCDVITSCAMFYDLDDPHRFVSDIVSSLAPRGVWINQLNDAATMLSQNAWDAICHEHVVYYDITNLRRLYANHGLRILAITRHDVNGGSIRIVATHAANQVLSRDSEVIEPLTPFALTGFATRARRWRSLAYDVLSLLRGEVWCYGASTKGSTLLQYLDLSERFRAIADRNPAKHGLLMAGTWLPITDELTMRTARPDALLVLPWGFRDEFVRRETELRAQGTAMIFPLPNLEFVL